MRMLTTEPLKRIGTRFAVFLASSLLLAVPAAGSGSELPLVMERTIEFDTDEGTWMSVDVAPSGENLVFDLLGDLYVLPVAGGAARPLTDGPAFDTQPRFSPDGRWIAFVSDRDGSENLWIMRADGTDAHRLSDGYWDFFSSPVWLPGGEGVVVSQNDDGYWGGYGLWLYRIDGSQPAPLIESQPGRHSMLGAAVSRDGRYVYFALRRDPFEYTVPLPIWQVARLDLQTGNVASVAAQPGGSFRPVLSPDGRMLAYGARFDARTGLRMRNLESSADSWLIHPVQRDDQESSVSTVDVLPGYAFTPDGKALIAAFDGKLHRIDAATGKAQVIPFSARVKQAIGPNLHVPRRIEDGESVRARIIHDPVLAPGGRRLAFAAFSRLHVMDLPAGDPKRVTEVEIGEFQPAWSPDGRWLAYVTWDENEGGALWKISTDGHGQPIRLTGEPAYYGNPAWSPDGSHIAALRKPTYAYRLSQTFQTWPQYRYEGGHGTVGDELVWISSSGGAAHHVTMWEWLGQPHFVRTQPDRIYVPTGSGLMSFPLDGGDGRVELRATWSSGTDREFSPGALADFRISPDGSQALVRAAGHWLYRVDLPVDRAQPVEVDPRKSLASVERVGAEGADSFGWSAGGEEIAWSVGSTLFRLPAGSRQQDAGEADRAVEIPIRVERPRHRPRGIVMLRGARAITMRGDEVIPRADVLIRDNRIAAVGPEGSVEVPEGARVIDLGGKILLPGFIDLHSHWHTPSDVLDRQPWGLLAPLAFGVTSGRDPSTSQDYIAYHDMTDAGMLLGPRAFTTGPAIDSSLDFQSLDEARDVLRRYSKHYGLETVKSYTPGNRRQRQWVAMASREQGLMPTIEGWMDFKGGITGVIDGNSGHEHNIPIVPLYKDVVELVARSQIAYTLTLLVSYGGPEGDSNYFTNPELLANPRTHRYLPPELLQGGSYRRPWVHPAEQVYPLVAASAASIVRAGGRVGVGAHGQFDGPDFHWEMWAMHADGQGMTPMEVLRAATIHAAEAIGYEADLGSIEPGKLADLVVLAEDPLADFYNTEKVAYVMKNGELFEAASLNKIWPEEVELPSLWWWKGRN